MSHRNSQGSVLERPSGLKRLREPEVTDVAKAVRAMPPAMRDEAILGITDRVRPRNQPYLSETDDYHVMQRTIDVLTRAVATINSAVVELQTVELPTIESTTAARNMLSLADAVTLDRRAIEEAAYHMRTTVISYRDEMLRRRGL